VRGGVWGDVFYLQLKIGKHGRLMAVIIRRNDEVRQLSLSAAERLTGYRRNVARCSVRSILRRT
jgi:hypothetical protein